MRLTLGSRGYELATRALVVGAVDAGRLSIVELCRRAEGLVADGADVIEVVAGESGVDGAAAAVAALAGGLTTPVGIGTTSVDVLRAAYRAGAVLGPDLDAGAAARAGAAVIVRGDDPDVLIGAARAAEAAGVPPDRVLLAPGLDGRSGEARRFASLGYPIVLSATAPQPDTALHDPRAAALTLTALGVIAGCRVVRADDVRGTRRVCDVLAAVLEATLEAEG